MYDDRAEIISPGGMFEGAPIQECDISSVRSVRRNPIIADLFHRMKYMERRGSGLKKIVSETARLPGYRDQLKPEFFSTSSDFRVILKNVNYDMSGTTTHETTHDATYETTHDAAHKTTYDAVHEPIHETVQETTIHETAHELMHETIHDAAHNTTHLTILAKKQKQLLRFCKEARSRNEMQSFLEISNRSHFGKAYLKPLLATGQLKMTIPEKPKSRNQRYITAAKNAITDANLYFICETEQKNDSNYEIE